MLRYILYFLAVVLFFPSCETLQITQSWKIDRLPSNGMNNILVMGLNRESDRSILFEMEKHLSEDLRGRGYNASSALSVFGPHYFDRLSEQEALNKLQQSGYDAVLTIVMLDKDKERYYIPGRVMYTPYVVYYSRFWGYRTALVQRVYEPGYYVSDTKYFWETNLYSLREAQLLLFSAQSKSFEPGNASTFGHQYARSMINRMVDQGVLK